MSNWYAFTQTLLIVFCTPPPFILCIRSELQGNWGNSALEKRSIIIIIQLLNLNLSVWLLKTVVRLVLLVSL